MGRGPEVWVLAADRSHRRALRPWAESSPLTMSCGELSSSEPGSAIPLGQLKLTVRALLLRRGNDDNPSLPIL
jgi:hypothetical protein